MKRYMIERLKRPEAAQRNELEITEAEMDRSIGSLASGKSAGEDDIENEMIQHLGPKAREVLLHLFNRCWEGSKVPQK